MLIKLGNSSHGTVVFKGSFQGRQVAVKRLVREHHDITLVEREASLLEHADDHPNVIRCFYHEFDKDYLFIALALCPASLADIIERRGDFREIADSFDPKRALHEIMSGLEYLHLLDIVHRNINPQNILISSAKEGKSHRYRMVISGFGLCKKLEGGETSFLPTAGSTNGGGTPGWRAPEILRWEVGSTAVNETQARRLTKSVDIFALGCVYCYYLTQGRHPFGPPHKRENNIRAEKMLLESQLAWAPLGEGGPEALDLIGSMLDCRPAFRCVC